MNCNVTFAGSESHGGVGVACIDKEGKIISVQLLDLYLAGNIFTLRESQKSVDEQVSSVLDQFKQLELYHWEISTALGFVRRDLTPLKRGVKLGIIPRKGNLFSLESACQKGATPVEVTIANYTSTGFLFVDMELYEKMTPTHQAALLIHEALYKIARVYSDDVNIQKIQQLVGYLFSNEVNLSDLESELFSLFNSSRRFLSDRSKESMNLLEKIDYHLLGKTLECRNVPYPFQEESSPARYRYYLKVVKGDLGWMPRSVFVDNDGEVFESHFEYYIGDGFMSMLFRMNETSSGMRYGLIVLQDLRVNSIYAPNQEHNDFYAGVRWIYYPTLKNLTESANYSSSTGSKCRLVDNDPYFSVSSKE